MAGEKTNVELEVCLNRQLLKMFRKFKWSRFHFKTYRLVRRMSEWLGIFGYDFKTAILDATVTVATNLDLPQQVAVHWRPVTI